MDFKILDKILEDERPYRLKQANKAIFKDLLTNWDDATNLPLELRKTLTRQFPLSLDGSIIDSKESDSVKAIIRLD